MGQDLRLTKPFQGMGKFDPPFSLMHIVVRNTAGLIPTWFVIRHRHSNVLGCIQPRFLSQIIDHSFYGMTRIEYVVDNQQPVVISDPLDQIVQPMYPDRVAALVNTTTVG